MPKPSQNRPKIDQHGKKINIKIRCFLKMEFSSIFINFWWIFHWFLNLRTFIFMHPSMVLALFFKFAISLLHVLLKSILESKIMDFGSQNPPKIDEKSIKICIKINIKITSKNDWIFDRFLTDFGSIFGRFLVDFWLIFGWFLLNFY